VGSALGRADPSHTPDERPNEPTTEEPS